MQMASLLSKILYRYDLKLVDPSSDWVASSKVYVVWWKAPMMVTLEERVVGT